MNRRQRAGSRAWAFTMVTAFAFLSGCSVDRDEERSVAAEIEFGIWVPDAYGELEFVATDEVPNVEDQAFGWRVPVGDPDADVKWIETMTLPAAPESWEGVDENPNVVVSEDGRTSTQIGAHEPVDGYVENIWYVAVGDPPGEYVMSVELEDGRMRRFVFRLGPPVAAAAEAI